MSRENPYAPKYYIWVVYPNGNSQVVTAGNSNPPKAATFSDMDVDKALEEFRAVEAKRGGFKYFHAELIGDKTYHL